MTTPFSLHQQSFRHNGRACRLKSLHPIPDAWRTRPLYLFVSLRNPRFSRCLLRWFVDLCAAQQQSGTICVVDDPYRHNEMARRGLATLPPDRAAQLARESWEVQRRVDRVLRATGTDLVTRRSWQAPAGAAPGFLIQEVTAAYAACGRFHTAVAAQVTAMKGGNLGTALDVYARFFLEEVPPLLWTYYGRADGHATGVVDVYPGAQAPLLWRIERGDFAAELPETTRFVQAAPPLIYLHVT